MDTARLRSRRADVGSWQAQQSYPADPASPRRARQFCAEQFTASLGTRPELVAARESAMLLVSELMTNAVNAGAARTTLLIGFEPSLVRVGVVDDADGLPRVVTAGPQDVRGRGLAIVATLADHWGVDPLGAGKGKRVWAEINLPGR